MNFTFFKNGTRENQNSRKWFISNPYIRKETHLNEMKIKFLKFSKKMFCAEGGHIKIKLNISLYQKNSI